MVKARGSSATSGENVLLFKFCPLKNAGLICAHLSRLKGTTITHKRKHDEGRSTSLGNRKVCSEIRELSCIRRKTISVHCPIAHQATVFEGRNTAVDCWHR